MGEDNSIVFSAMGTIVRIAIPASTADAGLILAAGQAEIIRLDQQLSIFRTDSEISQLNNQLSGWVQLTPDTVSVLRKAQQLIRQTDGLFNPAIGNSTRIWRDAIHGNISDADPKHIFAEAKVRGLSSNQPNGANFLIHHPRYGYKLAPGAEIDLGAIAKGFAADKARSRCLSLGALSVLVSIGSSSISLISPAQAKPYRVGIRSPWPEIEMNLGYLQLKDGSVSVSGSDQQTWVVDGVNYHHLIDPRTGCPAQSGLSAVIVIAQEGMIAEAYSTALFVMGLDAGLDFCAKTKIEALFLTQNRRIIGTQGSYDLFRISREAKNQLQLS